MKIIITMAGQSKRFKEAGIETPKYEIKFGDKTLFEWSLLSLKNFYEYEFIFVALLKNKPTKFIDEKCKSIGISNYKVILLDSNTKGQAETAYYCKKYIDANESVIIYNIDTYFRSDELDILCTLDCDGLIPVFFSNSDNYSFVKPSGKNLVSEIKEKIKISNLATIGLYYFSKWAFFLKAYNESYKELLEKYKELYIAPIYNSMIKSGKKIKYIEFNNNNISILGTPSEINNASAILLDDAGSEDIIYKYIDKKYNNNYSNDVFKLLINKEYYILKFYKNKRKMENEIKLSNIIMDKDYKVLYKGFKNSKYYIIRKYIEGELLEDNDNINSYIVIKLGKELKKIHSTKIDSRINTYTTKEIFLKWLKSFENSDIKTDKIKKVFYKRLEIFNSEIAVTHMDFRLGNVIIGNDLELKVIDFEGAKITDKYFDFVKIRRELKKYNGLWDEFKKAYKENLDENKIDFYEFLHSIGAISYIYSNNKSKNSFYFENMDYLNQYIKKYIE